MAKFFVYPFAIAGDKTAVPDPTQGDGSVSWQSGFPSDYQLIYGTDPDAKAIPRYKFNELLYDITNAIRQYQTHGIPDFITTVDNLGTPFPYDAFSIVRYDDGMGVLLYRSLVNGNTNLPTDPSTWAVISDDGLSPGMTIMHCAAGLPPGRYLVCDGSAVSRTTYQLLFNAVGTTWGIGDGSTTFNLPDFRGRTLVGADGPVYGSLSNTVGSVGGSATHTLTIGEMPSHNHPGSFLSADDRDVQGTGSPPTCPIIGAVSGATVGVLTITAQGSNAPHNIIQPSAVVLPVIKY